MHVLTLKYDSYRNTKVAGSADGHVYSDFKLALLYSKKTPHPCDRSDQTSSSKIHIRSTETK
jgi:hypothetical protein